MIISTFYKNHLEKPIATYLMINHVPSITKPSAKLFFETLKENKNDQPKLLSYKLKIGL